MQTRYCTVANCRRKHRARGYCIMHYRRWARYGDPKFVKSRFVTPLELRSAVEQWYDARAELGSVKTLAHRLGLCRRTVEGLIKRYRDTQDLRRLRRRRQRA